MKLKFASIICVKNSSAGISSCPCLLASLHLHVVEVVWFSNKTVLESKVFEVMFFLVLLCVHTQPGFLPHADDVAA